MSNQSAGGRDCLATAKEPHRPATLTVAWIFAGTAILLQMVCAGRYGYFRDELYYLAFSHHLDWGFVDLAPLSPLILRLVRIVIGDSLHAIRLLPALAEGTEILLTGVIVRELGGKRFAVLVAFFSDATDSFRAHCSVRAHHFSKSDRPGVHAGSSLLFASR